MEKTLKYGRIQNAVLLVFPTDKDAEEWVRTIQTENLLNKFNARQLDQDVKFTPKRIG